MKSGNTLFERLITWFCGYSPSLAACGLRPSFLWALTGDSKHTTKEW